MNTHATKDYIEYQELKYDREKLKTLICNFIDNCDEVMKFNFESFLVPDYENSTNGWKCYKSTNLKSFNLVVYEK